MPRCTAASSVRPLLAASLLNGMQTWGVSNLASVHLDQDLGSEGQKLSPEPMKSPEAKQVPKAVCWNRQPLPIEKQRCARSPVVGTANSSLKSIFVRTLLRKQELKNTPWNLDRRESAGQRFWGVTRL